jgi:transcription initiation factor IIE alpha subunit
MNSEQQIPCPVCKTKIHFDAKQLLLGIQFSCSNCLASIGLAKESKEEVKGALDKLKELRGD